MKNILTLTLFLFLIFGCSKDDSNDTKTNTNNPSSSAVTSCDFKAVISPKEFKEAPAFPLTIQSLNIEGDCLKIQFSASGCDGESWEVKLIDSGTILDSDPAQRGLRLSLENKEICQAVISKEVSFDISNLKDGGNQILLNFSQSGKSILYKY